MKTEERIDNLLKWPDEVSHRVIFHKWDKGKGDAMQLCDFSTKWLSYEQCREWIDNNHFDTAEILNRNTGEIVGTFGVSHAKPETPQSKPTTWLCPTGTHRHANELPCECTREPAQHSPLPWHVAAEVDGDYAILGAGKDTGRATSAGPITLNAHVAIVEGEGNAKLIVASVNHADKLAEALRDALNMIDPARWDKSDVEAALAEYEEARQQ